jgi:[3-methyl-2-oxobutanoate dehydrogenase (acetyl-transferring)] kinase
LLTVVSVLFSQADHVGIINLHLRLKDVIERWADFVIRLAQGKYGKAPRIKLSGHINATFPYIQLPLDYIVPELLKNAVRATIETHVNVPEADLPPVQITIANNDVDFIIRLSDRGGGIQHAVMPKIMQYSFSTAEIGQNHHHVGIDGIEGGLGGGGGAFDNLLDAANATTTGN